MLNLIKHIMGSCISSNSSPPPYENSELYKNKDYTNAQLLCDHIFVYERVNIRHLDGFTAYMDKKSCDKCNRVVFRPMYQIAEYKPFIAKKEYKDCKHEGSRFVTDTLSIGKKCAHIARVCIKCIKKDSLTTWWDVLPLNTSNKPLVKQHCVWKVAHVNNMNLDCDLRMIYKKEIYWKKRVKELRY